MTVTVTTEKRSMQFLESSESEKISVRKLSVGWICKVCWQLHRFNPFSLKALIEKFCFILNEHWYPSKQN